MQQTSFASEERHNQQGRSQGQNREDRGTSQEGDGRQHSSAQRDYAQLVRELAEGRAIDETRRTQILQAAGKTLRDLQNDGLKGQR